MTASAAPRPEVDEGTIVFAGRVFDLARGDCARKLRARLDPYSVFGTVTPIMSLARTRPASRSISQPSVPAGRIGSTIQR